MSFRPEKVISTPEDIDALVEQIKSTTATDLDLHELNITDNAMTKIIPVLAAKQEITSVNLLGNPLGVQTIVMGLQVLLQRFAILKYRWLDPLDMIREAKSIIGPAGQYFNHENDYFIKGLFAYISGVIDLVADLKNPPPLARVEMMGRIVRYIGFKLFVASNPQVCQIEIKKPLIITGMFRTGTTLLLNTLASVDGVRSPRLWEADSPLPPPTKENYLNDPRIAQTNEQLERVFKRVMPELSKYHHMQADFPEECLFILKHKFIFFDAYYSNVFPKYTEWFKSVDQSKVYEQHKIHLQILSSQYPPQSHWLLKSPHHLDLLDHLDQTYPDSNLVFCHRDPVDCLGSGISLFTYGGISFRKSYDRTVEGKRYFELEVESWKKAMKLIDEWNSTGRGNRIFHCYFKDLVSDTVGMCRRIHEHFGYPIPDNFEDGIKKWLEENPQGKFGSHHYSLEEFGITKEDVHVAFADYYEKYFPDLIKK